MAKKAVTFRVDPELVVALGAACELRGVSKTDAVDGALRLWLGGGTMGATSGDGVASEPRHGKGSFIQPAAPSPASSRSTSWMSRHYERPGHLATCRCGVCRPVKG